MHSKRSLIRTLTRLLYTGGFLSLIAGLLLSALSSPALAAGLPSFRNPSGNQSASLQPLNKTIGPDCGCETPTPTKKGPTATPSSEGKSSLVFTSGCDCSCTEVRAVISNVGTGDMKTAVRWQLYYSASGNPSAGHVVQSGSLGPIKKGGSATLTYVPVHPGNYAYRVDQEASHIGPAVIWSNSCMVSGDCYTRTPTAPVTTHTPTQPVITRTPTLPVITHTPTVTETAPFVIITGTQTSTPTHTVTPPVEETTITPTRPIITRTPTPTTHIITRTPTVTPTHETMNYNLSAVCGYGDDNYLLWKVANNTDTDLNYTWKVSGSDESGSGHAPAHGDDYFTTSAGEKTVELLVNGEVVDRETSLPACKQALVLSYACTPEGNLEWSVTNPNDFGVDYTWKLDTGVEGRGVLPAGGSQVIAQTDNAVHHMELTWTDTRPGTHTVSLTSSPQDCGIITRTPTPTNTPTPSETAPFIIITGTKTPTVTRTATPPVVETTITPTPSRTATREIITHTPTVTRTITRTPELVIVTITVTPTVTNTSQVLTRTITPTVTNTNQVLTRTVTPTETLTPEFFIVTTTVTTTATTTITPTATRINTLPPPEATVTGTPGLISVTGADMTQQIGASGLSLFGSLLTNTGLFMLGLALALSAFRGQLKG